MSEINQRIMPGNGTITRHPHYNQAELERLLSTIIRRTSCASIEFKNTAGDHTDSSKEGSLTKITVSKDNARSSFVFKIQLAGKAEFWTIYTTFHARIQGKINPFFKELKKAVVAVCEEENRNLPTPNNEKRVPPPLPNSDRKGDSLVVNNAKGMKIKKRGRSSRASKLITSEILLSITQKWMKYTAGVTRISQRELGEVTSKLGIEIGNTALVAFLKQVGVVNIIPSGRNPILELTQIGIAILEDHEKYLELEKREDEEEKLLREKLVFAKKALPALSVLRDLRGVRTQLKDIAVAKANVTKRIKKLQEEIVAEEKKLAGLEVSEKSQLEKIGRIVSSIDQDEIIKLIEIAEISAQ